MGRYAYKKSLPDWDVQTVADLKIALKAYIFDACLHGKTDEAIREHIQAELAEFRKEFEPEQSERADGYVKELTALAEDVLNMTRNAMHGMTPYMFAAAAAKPEMLSESQKAQVGKAAQAVLHPIDNSTMQRVAETYKADGAADGKVPDSGYNRATAAQTYYRDIHKQVKQFISEFETIKESRQFTANVNPRAYTDMGIRFKAYQDEKRRLISEGVQLVYVAPHANCSRRCQPWQGRIYSLDGTTGTKDGHKFIPIEQAADNVTYTSQRTGRTYQAGLFAYNCRHSMTAYKNGQTVETIPADVIERQRAAEEHQRALERSVRFYKERAIYMDILSKANKNAGFHKVATESRKTAVQLAKEYRRFSIQSGIPYVPERLTVMQGENIYSRTKQGQEDELEVRARVKS